MENIQGAASAEIWRAAQHRRTEDLAEWFCLLKQSEKSPATDQLWRHLRPRLASMQALMVLMVTFAALASVSAVVHAGKQPKLVLKPTAAMPAVNVP